MEHDGAHEVFSAGWAGAWQAALNDSAAYREAAARWEAPLVLALREGGAVWADLWHGGCRAARAATPEDLASAVFVIQADAAIWQRLLSGDLDPVFALMSGKLKLERGSVSALLPFARAAREMVLAATRVATRFPARS